MYLEVLGAPPLVKVYNIMQNKYNVMVYFTRQTGLPNSEIKLPNKAEISLAVNRRNFNLLNSCKTSSD